MSESTGFDGTTLVAEEHSLPNLAAVEYAFDRIEPPRFAWCGPNRRFVTGGAAATISAESTSRFAQLQTAIDQLPTIRSATGQTVSIPLVGGGQFHTVAAESGRPDWEGFQAAQFLLPRAVIASGPDRPSLVTLEEHPSAANPHHTRYRQQLTSSIAPTEHPPGINKTASLVSQEEWQTAVDTTVETIMDTTSPLQKAVLAQSLRLELAHDLSVSEALIRLGQRYPDCYRFAFQPTADAGTFIGATPEQLLTRQGTEVQTTALAGSIQRGTTPAADRQLQEQLRSDQKVTREHASVVKTIREQLRPHATSITIGERSIRTLPSVQHFQTPIQATAPADTSTFEILETLHPTSAVGGEPPDVAQQLIASTEPFDRGWYAGPIGYVDPAGNGTIAVGIRSALVSGHHAHLFAGAGIVAGSDPAAEWKETQLKYQPMYDLFDDSTES